MPVRLGHASNLLPLLLPTLPRRRRRGPALALTLTPPLPPSPSSPSQTIPPPNSSLPRRLRSRRLRPVPPPRPRVLLRDGLLDNQDPSPSLSPDPTHLDGVTGRVQLVALRL